MLKLARSLLLLVTLLSAPSQFLILAQTASSKPADVVLRDGAIYTVDAARSWAQAVAIVNGRIVYVGNDNGVKKFIGSQTRVFDLTRCTKLFMSHL